MSTVQLNTVHVGRFEKLCRPWPDKTNFQPSLAPAFRLGRESLENFPYLTGVAESACTTYVDRVKVDGNHVLSYGLGVKTHKFAGFCIVMSLPISRGNILKFPMTRRFRYKIVL